MNLAYVLNARTEHRDSTRRDVGEGRRVHGTRNGSSKVPGLMDSSLAERVNDTAREMEARETEAAAEDPGSWIVA